MRNLRSIALLAGVSLLCSSCGSPEAELPSEGAREGLSFEEFKATAHDEPDSDVFVVNGDIPVEGVDGLREYYDTFVNPELGTREDALAVYCLNGQRIKWSATAARNLTYCISTASFGSRYSTVVSAMASAAATWETVANVNFIHLSQYDGSCTASQAGVVFDVRQTTTTSYLARAFFPNSSRSGRNILISTSLFGSTGPYTLAGVLRHELGHVLGFRHEPSPTPNPAPGCYEDSNFCRLTPYDPDSIMGYPHCGGIQTWERNLSTLDQQGAHALYP
ncbi:M57 family metalloprotease [Pyxidicoccus xibeiensis]|uniref:M57 family metalloprotease n=1 Tax=Pyxidicoccus xibeiensis TaxID=2906759 RepID=UPI0020A74519|nr:M57 family metalloprotease [Pyxidicoccus xibeiensis]MCP3143180.1 M57 family metalloprotease [Pyxidicoccus xibeiensis]